MEKTEDAIIVDEQVCTIQSATGKAVKIVFEGSPIPSEEEAWQTILKRIAQIQ